MKATYPLVIAMFLLPLVMTAIEAHDNERYAKQQQAAKLKANKRLFQKLYVQAEEMTFPVSYYKDEK